MIWKEIISWEIVETIIQASFVKPQIIFKHSTRCNISSIAKNRIEKSTYQDAEYWLLDLIRYRNVSNQISEHFSVIHESPQILLIFRGSCVFDESHYAIDMDEIVEQITSC